MLQKLCVYIIHTHIHKYIYTFIYIRVNIFYSIAHTIGSELKSFRKYFIQVLINLGDPKSTYLFELTTKAYIYTYMVVLSVTNAQMVVQEQ